MFNPDSTSQTTQTRGWTTSEFASCDNIINAISKQNKRDISKCLTYGSLAQFRFEIVNDERREPVELVSQFFGHFATLRLLLDVRAELANVDELVQQKLNEAPRVRFSLFSWKCISVFQTKNNHPFWRYFLMRNFEDFKKKFSFKIVCPLKNDVRIFANKCKKASTNNFYIW